MTDTTFGQDGRTRHWLVDAVLGGAVALGAITLAHASLPESLRFTAAPQPVAVATVAVPPQPERPAALIAFADPVPGRVVVSPFGLRQLPWEENGRLHAGVDISADFGAPVLAAADGVVVEAGHSSTYGRFVAVRHAEGLTSFYAHMGAVQPGLAPGRALKAGDLVGRIGSSGTSTGPHLHFELRDRRGRPLNPGLFLGKAFAEADDLPLRKAQRFGRHVRIAHVSRIPDSKKALMQEKLEREAAEKALLLAERDLKRRGKIVEAAAAAGAQGVPAAAVEQIEGLKELGVGDDGRPKAQLTL